MTGKTKVDEKELEPHETTDHATVEFPLYSDKE